MGAVFDHKAWAAKSGPVYGDLAVGDITQLNVDGAATDFIVVHQGKPSSLYDDSCDGAWLLMKDVYSTWSWGSTNSYAANDMDTYLNGTFLALFDAAVQSAIKQVKIPYVNGTGSGGSVASGSNGLSAKVFLLSGYEVGMTTALYQYTPVDGAKLDYFVSGSDAAANAKRIANLSGSAVYWWLRSPDTSSAAYVLDVWKNGSVVHVYSCTGMIGVRPCLIMPAGQRIFG